MRLRLVILSMLLIQACNSTPNSQKTTKIAPVNSPKVAQKHTNTPPVDVKGKTELVLAPMIVEAEFSKKQNRVWLPFTPVTVDDKIYLDAGEYRIRMHAKNSETALSSELQIPPATPRAYLHVEVSPDLKHVYGWGSLLDVSDAGFQDEKLRFYCIGSSPTMSFLEPTFPDYAVSACEELVSRQHPIAAQQLGYFYQKGIGVDVDSEKAITYYKQAIDLDNWNAGHSLLFLYNEQERNKEKIQLLQAMVKQGDAFAKSILAEEYVTGTNVDANPERAKALAQDGFAEGLSSNALVLVHLELNKIKGQPNFIEAKALMNIYKKQNLSPSAFSYELQHRIDRALKPSDKAAVQQRQEQLENTINRKAVGSVCLDGITQNPAYQNRTLHYQINDDQQKYPLRAGSNARIGHLPVFFNTKHQINIYADDEIVVSQQIEFQQADGLDLCFGYDAEDKIERLSPNPNPSQCDCKPKNTPRV